MSINTHTEEEGTAAPSPRRPLRGAQRLPPCMCHQVQPPATLPGPTPPWRPRPSSASPQQPDPDPASWGPFSPCSLLDTPFRVLPALQSPQGAVGRREDQASPARPWQPPGRERGLRCGRGRAQVRAPRAVLRGAAARALPTPGRAVPGATRAARAAPSARAPEAGDGAERAVSSAARAGRGGARGRGHDQGGRGPRPGRGRAQPAGVWSEPGPGSPHSAPPQSPAVTPVDTSGGRAPEPTPLERAPPRVRPARAAGGGGAGPGSAAPPSPAVTPGPRPPDISAGHARGRGNTKSPVNACMRARAHVACRRRRRLGGPASVRVWGAGRRGL